eukprot:137287-Rhodomonas_salina.2
MICSSIVRSWSAEIPTSTLSGFESRESASRCPSFPGCLGQMSFWIGEDRSCTSGALTGPPKRPTGLSASPRTACAGR